MSVKSFAPGHANKVPVDIQNLVVGKTKVHLDTFMLGQAGCCGNLLCFSEFTVTGIGTYTDKSGQEVALINLENGMFITPDLIDYTID